MDDRTTYDLQGLVDAADDAELLAAVDGLCGGRQWDALEDLAHRCRAAVELGRQLWGVAMHIDYRLAREAPAGHAARAVAPGAGRFALGPLTEVVAAQHTWSELAPHLVDPATRSTVAQERVLRGEDLCHADVAAELPLRLAPFEPSYPLPHYRDRSARFPAPPSATSPTGPPRELPHADPRPTDDAARALHELAATWATESTGTVRVVAAHGDGPEGVGLLTPTARVEEISGDEALALMQWAGASGGARGRRRGGAAGRFAAWWALAAVAGLDWDDDPEALAEELTLVAGELRMWRWAPATDAPRPIEEPATPETPANGTTQTDPATSATARIPDGPGGEQGWVLRLAIADPLDGLSWVIDAHDRVDSALPD
ncbi:DUF6183 family protein [Egibacter rhizosphaerae]|uniref:DUF6183 family protein n=1 Tax=Egibacter rhizosphaerae TaxID=1670831 RepID=UPI0013F149CD|nr:DUF6183 family protein [Egibacter rhizosphaerae]